LAAINVSKAQNWRLVVIVVVAIVTLLTVTNGFSLYEARKAHTEVDSVVDNSMKSIELVHQMRVDMYRQQQLVDAHIVATDAAIMAEAEAKIAAVDADFAAAASAYEPLVSFAGEAAAWQRLKDDVAAIRKPLAGRLRCRVRTGTLKLARPCPASRVAWPPSARTLTSWFASTTAKRRERPRESRSCSARRSPSPLVCSLSPCCSSWHRRLVHSSGARARG